MFVTIRKVTIEKGNLDMMVEKFNAPSPVDGVDGLVRRELLINQTRPDTDLLTYLVYWLDKASFMAWERSPVHLALHKAKAQEVKPTYIISVQKEAYETTLEKRYRD